MFSEESDLTNFENRVRDMIDSPLPMLLVHVYPGQYSANFHNDSNKENGKFVYFESEIKEEKKPSHRRNMSTTHLDLYICGGCDFNIISWFIRIFPNLCVLELESRTINLKPLEELTKLTSLSMDVGKSDFLSLTLPNLEQLKFIYAIPYDAVFDMNGYKEFFQRHGKITSLRFEIIGANDPDQEHHTGLIRCAIENLENMMDLDVETGKYFENFHAIQSSIETHSKIGFTMRYSESNSRIENTIVKKSDSEVVMTRTRKPRIVGGIKPAMSPSKNHILS